MSFYNNYYESVFAASIDSINMVFTIPLELPIAIIYFTVMIWYMSHNKFVPAVRVDSRMCHHILAHYV